MRSYKKLISQSICSDIKTSVVFLLFYVLSANYIIYSFLAEETFKNYFRLAIISVIVGYCIWRCVKKKVNIRFFVLMGTAFLVILKGGTLSLNVAFLLLLVVFLVGMKSENINTMAFNANFLMVVFVLTCLILGLVDNYHYINSDGRSRYTFGFTNVNAASVFAYSFAVTYLLSRKNPKWKYVPGVLITFSVVYLATDSRTAFWCLIFLMIAWAAIHHLPINHSRFLVGIFVIAMFITPCLWRLPFVCQGPIDDLLSDRPTLFVRYISQHTMLNFLFGGSRVAAIDNSYLILLYNCGIFLYAVCGIIVLIAMDQLILKKCAIEAGFCLSMLLYGQLEGVLLRPEILCVPIFWYYMFKNFSLKGIKSLGTSVCDSIKSCSTAMMHRPKQGS